MFNDQKLYYTGHDLDRQAHLRTNHKELDERLLNGHARVVPYWRGLHWMSDLTIKQPDLLSVEVATLRMALSDHIFLGEYNGVAYFSVDLSDHSEEAALGHLPKGKFVELRHTPILRRANLAPALAYLRGLYQWHNLNQFCSRCGAKTKPANAGHSRKCTSCNHGVYPRLDPAIIVLIEHIPDHGAPVCLLGRHRSGVPNMYSTLAGFVETGESLEAAVQREVFEEVGLEVDNIRYVSSQPWPFPSALMVGFFASAKTRRLKLDQNEVQEAQWLTAPEIVKQVAQNTLVLSREDSIARYLIQRWVNIQMTTKDTENDPV